MGVTALMLMPERNCNGCTKQKQWGCHARKIKEVPGEGEDERDCWVNPADMGIEIDGELLFVCPRRTLLDHPTFWNRLFMFHRAYEKGLLPDKGALQDQSNAGMLALSLLATSIAEAKEQLRQE